MSDTERSERVLSKEKEGRERERSIFGKKKRETARKVTLLPNR